MTPSGRLVIMGSGETAPTMIKAHRFLLDGVPEGAAVLLDTPYAFQENAADITARARHYFRTSVGREIRAAGWGEPDTDALTRERALASVREARWVFAGPGSPTYALRAWRDTELPGVLRETVFGGGTVVFASAAALTLGSRTVPVYEIYKAGIAPYWEPGLDLVAQLTGCPAVVIPHYDNAEGGHHDTRFCYLGERRLAQLESELPENAFVLGVDEHTAVILDLGTGTVSVLGRGVLTIRRRGMSSVHPNGSELRLADLALPVRPLADSLPHRATDRGATDGPLRNGSTDPGADADADADADAGAGAGETVLSLRAAADECRQRFAAALSDRDVDSASSAVLDLEQAMTDWASDTLSSDDGEHARGRLRSMVVELGDLARTGVADPADAIRPYVELLVSLRTRARDGKDFAASDEIRDVLARVGIDIRDTPDGPRWSLTNRLCTE